MPATDTTTTDKDIAPDGLPVVTLPPEVDPSTPAGLREAVAIAIETEQAHFSMGTWRNTHAACGTTACLAGWALHLSPHTDYVLDAAEATTYTEICEQDDFSFNDPRFRRDDEGVAIPPSAVWLPEGSDEDAIMVGQIDGRTYGFPAEVARSLLGLSSDTLFFNTTGDVLSTGIRAYLASDVQDES